MRSVALGFGLAEAAARGMNWALLLFLALWLEPEPYGVIALLVALEAVGAGLTICGQDRALLRFLPSAEGQGPRARILGAAATVVALTLVAGLVPGLLLLQAVQQGLGLDGGPGPEPDVVISVAFVALIAARVVHRLYVAVARNAEDRSRFTLLRVGFHLLRFPLILVALGTMDVVLAYCLGTLAAYGTMVALAARPLGLPAPPAPGTVPRFASFGAPLMLHATAGILLSMQDRVMLAAWLPIAELGRYALGYQIGASVTFAYAILAVVADARLFRLAARRPEDLGAALRRYGTALLAVAGALGAALVAVLPLVEARVFGAAYAGVAELALVIFLAHLMMPVYLCANLSLSAAGRTGNLTFATVVAMAVNVVLNVLLIPAFGSTGAAVATLGGNAVLAGLVFDRARRRGLGLAGRPDLLLAIPAIGGIWGASLAVPPVLVAALLLAFACVCALVFLRSGAGPGTLAEVRP